MAKKRERYVYKVKKRGIRTINCDCKDVLARDKTFMSGAICRCNIYPKGYGTRAFTYEDADVEFMYLRKAGTR